MISGRGDAEDGRVWNAEVHPPQPVGCMSRCRWMVPLIGRVGSSHAADQKALRAALPSATGGTLLQALMHRGPRREATTPANWAPRSSGDDVAKNRGVGRGRQCDGLDPPAPYRYVHL